MENLLKNQKSVMISSLNKHKKPEISYAPFIMKDNKIYIYISKAANHYYNLIDNKECSVMIIEDENDCKTIFARQRISFYCEANRLNEVDNSLFEAFKDIHGNEIMIVLKSLDFDMFKLSIKNGRVVKGFGEAFNIEVKDEKFELIQVTGTGHKMK